MWYIYVALFVAFICCLDQLLMDKRRLELGEKFNGPARWPIIGNALFFTRVGPKEYYETFKNIMEKYARTGTRIARFWIGTELACNIDDPKLLEVILTNQKFLSKSSQYNFMSESLGVGLLLSTNQTWFSRRRAITPTFHFKILEQFFEIFIKQNKILLGKIGDIADGRIFDIFPMITASVMNALCGKFVVLLEELYHIPKILETAMGCELKAEDFEYLNAVKQLGYLISSRFLTPWQRNDFLYSLTADKRALDNAAKVMHQFTRKIIEERRLKLTNEKVESLDNLDEDDVGLKKKMCLLDVLLQSTDGQPLTNADIQAEVDNFTFAGHDTTTNAICFTLFVISKYPEVQRKLNEEIDQVIGDGDVTLKIINEFKYLDLVIKETMRLYPPVPIIARRLHEEVDFGDFIAPANTNYNLIFFTLFRNPEVFKNPDEFIPERFLDTDNMSPYAYTPFSAGQRNCIGQKFAQLVIKNNIINILKNFVVVPGNIDPVLEINITLKCDGIKIGFKPKN